MKCDKASFTYRGRARDGHRLAELLSDISVNYESSRISGSVDLGWYLRELLLNDDLLIKRTKSTAEKKGTQ